MLDVLVGMTFTAFTTLKIDTDDYAEAERIVKETLFQRLGTLNAEVVDSAPGISWEYSNPTTRIVRVVPEGKKIEVKNESIAGID